MSEKGKNGQKTGNEYQKEPGGTFKEGNPGGGRPKGQKNYATLYRDALEKLAKLNDIDPDILEVEIAQKGIAKAREGDYRFYKDTLDRLFGKAQDNVDITSNNEPITGMRIIYQAEEDE